MTLFHNGHNPNGECSQQFAYSLLRVIEKKYGALISTARKNWERKFAGRDPADLCVTVRISADESQAERVTRFPRQFSEARERFVAN